VQTDFQVKFLSVDEESDGQRLDNFLLRQLKGVPKTHIYRIIRSGEVRQNKGRSSADARVKAGDVLRIPPIRLPAADTGARPAPAQEFPVLFEDAYFLAINKPAGVAVHGGSGVSFGVIEQLRQARPEAKFLELVHRLDRETSGILLLAKKRSALVALQAQFKERETGKTYLTLVRDWPASKTGQLVINKALHKYTVGGLDSGAAGQKFKNATAKPNRAAPMQADDLGERRVKVVADDHPDAMRAVSLVRLHQHLGEPANLALLAVTIKTGRTHQIRVHLTDAGFPLAGDAKYGDFEWNRQLQKQGLKRMFLHAWQLQIQHPATQEPLHLRCELPPELAAFVDAQAQLAGPLTARLTDRLTARPN
jgi:23S rRNA pseudouridine955/2504/2580 synthase